MITTGLLLAGLTTGGFYILYSKMPKRLQKFLVNRPLFTDVTAAIFTYVLFGTSTIIGLFAAAWAALIVSIMLAARKNKGIMLWFEKIKSGWKQLLTWIENWGQEGEVVVADFEEATRREEKVMVN